VIRIKKVELWQSYEPFEEASIRGEIATKKFWRKDIERACVELGGHNFDRGYCYRVLMFIQRPNQVKDVVRTIIKLVPGNIKWINLIFYKSSEKDEYEKVDVIDNLHALKDKIRKNDEKAKELAIKLVRNHLKEKMDPRKHIVPEYDMAFGYLLRKNDDRVLIAIIGYNFQAEDLIRNSLADFKEFGKVVGYWIEEVKKADLIELEEEEHSYTVLLGI
jgi:hypothetical protein